MVNVVTYSHTYEVVGEYTITVSVADDEGAVGTDTGAVNEISAPALEAIPTFTQWGLIVLGIIISAGMFTFIRRRKSLNI